MNDSTQGVSPLRQRMIEDMRMRKLAPKTQAAYVRSVRQLAGYLGRSPASNAWTMSAGLELSIDRKTGETLVGVKGFVLFLRYRSGFE